MLVMRLPTSLQTSVRWLNHTLVLGFCVFMAWFGTRFAIDAWSNPSPVLRLPLTWLYGPVGAVLRTDGAALPAGAAAAGAWPIDGRQGNLCWADWVPGILMLVLFALDTPIAFAIAIGALSFFLIDGEVPLNIFVQKMVTATDSYPLLAIPFFVLAGAIMNQAGITRRLLALADALVGHMTGALAQMCTVLATLLGGLTASSRADAAMLAKMLGPEMVTARLQPGVRRRHHLVRGDHHGADPAVDRPDHLRLHRRRLGRPAVHRRHRARADARGLADARSPGSSPSGAATCRCARKFAGCAEVGRTFRDALWALSIPVFIIVGIRYGIFTPTEAGAITVLYAIAGRACSPTAALRLADLPQGAEGDGARHRVGDADDLRRVGLRLLPGLGAHPAADGGLAGDADARSGAAAAADQRCC